MRARFGTGLYILLGVLAMPGATAAQPAPARAVELAFLNIQSGKGEVGLAGRPVLFADTQNCTDLTRPVNAWGVGIVQRALASGPGSDPSVLAVGLAEAWICGSAENVRRTLG
jgi:hypothetical protein